MQMTWSSIWVRRNWLQISFLFVTLSCVLYTTRILTYQRSFPEAERQKATSLAGPAGLNEKMVQGGPAEYFSERAAANMTSGVLGGATGGGASAPKVSDRKIVRASSLELTVAAPEEAAEKIRVFAEDLGGYLETAQISRQDMPNAIVTVRVPERRLEELKATIRKLAARVEIEKTDARDVTKEYVDMRARIRNLRAEEAQYLQIMKSAAKVQDMLDVSEKLSGVRGEIEQQQAEFETLSKQAEMASISVTLRAQPKPEAFGLNWQPMHRLKIAAHDALDGIADYASTIIAAILYLPVILLWAGTITLGIVTAWRFVRWVAREFFGFPKPLADAKVL